MIGSILMSVKVKGWMCFRALLYFMVQMICANDSFFFQ